MCTFHIISFEPINHNSTVIRPLVRFMLKSISMIRNFNLCQNGSRHLFNFLPWELYHYTHTWMQRIIFRRTMINYITFIIGLSFEKRKTLPDERPFSESYHFAEIRRNPQILTWKTTKLQKNHRNPWFLLKTTDFAKICRFWPGKPQKPQKTVDFGQNPQFQQILAKI